MSYSKPLKATNITTNDTTKREPHNAAHIQSIDATIRSTNGTAFKSTISTTN